MTPKTASSLPMDHPQRRALNDEVHARPPERIVPPMRLSYLVLMSGDRETDRADLLRLLEGTSALVPQPDANHYSADLGAFRVKWERHTEFCRYTFMVQGAEPQPFAMPAIQSVPQTWLSRLKGQTLTAIHASVIRQAKPPDPVKIADGWFAGNTLIGSTISGSTGRAYTDFRIHGDGFGRLLVYDNRMTLRQAGRLVQRLFEIDTYRMLALLALPLARELTPFLTASENELLEIMSAMQQADEMDEPVLLDRLTKLEAAVERRHTDSQYRFAAANAYYDLVLSRIDELREERIEGLQTFREFNDRRFSPAIATCRAVSARQAALSDRIARATVLLSTRVSVTRERQNQAVLQSMDRRAVLQLRLQQTVEGLSVAAITYYIVGLIYYAAKGVVSSYFNVSAETLTAISIPLVFALVGLGLYRFRKSLHAGDGT
jgi:uncharacterized membrane-anchored protein